MRDRQILEHLLERLAAGAVDNSRVAEGSP